MNIIRKIRTTKYAKDLKGIGIPKGTTLYVIKEGPNALFGEHHKLLVVRIDNGIGHLDLMPETVIRDTDVSFKEIKNNNVES